MRWDRDHQSSNLEDRRGQGPPLGGGGGGLGILWFVASRFGWKGVVALLVIAAAVKGFSMFTEADPRQATQGAGAQVAGQSDEQVRFVGFVFDDAQSYWQRTFASSSQLYAPAKIVVFTDAVASACGNASSAVGPFYCSRDERVFIDLDFYNELRTRFGAPGDFAQAYVLAHEMGHHIQNITNNLEHGGDSVRTELQADCLAGVWAKDAETRNLLEIGDLQEAFTAASAIGDDRIQRQTTGTVRPETFTHGSAQQRLAALRLGYTAGTPAACGLSQFGSRANTK
ncbi:MAG: neutral zinc metallopeptidase [Sandaracinaceae bacterium]|nr:neutral zinc metallopeptidase [Sandaracinaceae bacterium]